MPCIAYEDWSPKDETLVVVHHAVRIIARYAEEGYDLTLRQLYYQFVSEDLLPNKQSEYKRLGDIISKARRAGLIDWNAIVDRTRNLRAVSTWDSPAELVEQDYLAFRRDLWADQDNYVEVWFEKDALMGVFERAANRYRVPFFSCRGYTSDSEVWSAAQRLAEKYDEGKDCEILHFGDHDPSGIDMTRDINDRLELFGAGGVVVNRLALNMDQVRRYNPPPNPAKESDSRFVGYEALHGNKSWELDALNPTILGDLVANAVRNLVDEAKWNDACDREARERFELKAIASRYAEVAKTLPTPKKKDLAALNLNPLARGRGMSERLSAALEEMDEEV